MSNMIKTKVLIIGSGAAGYTAAVYAARAALDPVVVMGLQPGGQMTITTEVENYPGFADPIQGPWLMEQMQKQAENMGTKMITDTIITVEDLKATPKRFIGDSGDVYEADSVIIATGAQAKWLGLESEQKYMGFGVSACATCDGFFYREKEVLVIGGGNTAVEEALFLANICKKVTVIHRRDSFRAEKIMQDRLFKNEKINVIWDTVLEEVTGDGQVVTGATLKNMKSGETQDIPVDGVFVAIGHKPATDIFKGHMDMDDGGYLLSKPGMTATDIPGVFAAGDVTDHVYRQAVTAAGMGCMAALEADRYLQTLDAADDKAA